MNPLHCSKFCQTCNAPFVAERESQVYCSIRCRRKARNKRDSERIRLTPVTEASPRRDIRSGLSAAQMNALACAVAADALSGPMFFSSPPEAWQPPEGLGLVWEQGEDGVWSLYHDPVGAMLKGRK